MNAPFSTPVWENLGRGRVQTQSLRRAETVDLVVVGAGIQGLSTALHAARRGLSVRVLEAGLVGAGASSLNGGQVIPGLKYDPDWLLATFGERPGQRLIDFASSTADAVFDLIRSEALDVAHSRNGWIQAAHTEAALSAAHARDLQWRARGADVAMLDAAEIAAMTGAAGYLGGWLDRRAGVIDPLGYTLGLAGAAIRAGAAIAEHQKVEALRRSGDRWIATTESGAQISAGKVVVATNAYSDGLIPGLAETIVPLHSFQIATAPLSRDQAESILPGGQAVSDSRRILVYYRKSPDGRLMLGGRGRLALPRSASDWTHLEHALIRLYPSLRGVPVQQRWFGRVAMTPDHLPHIHEPEKGLIAAVGCQGRGLGLMTSLGARLADYVVDDDRDSLPFPVTPIRPIPFHRFHKLGVAATIAWYRTLDRLGR